MVIETARMKLKQRTAKEELLLFLMWMEKSKVIYLLQLVPGDETMKQTPPLDDLMGETLHFLLKIKAGKELNSQSRIIISSSNSAHINTHQRISIDIDNESATERKKTRPTRFKNIPTSNKSYSLLIR